MTLRHKLLTIFGALALLALVVAGITVWTQAQWAATEGALQGHYLRSLQVQRVRAATFRAFKEVPDAVTGGDPNARQEFDTLLGPIGEDFRHWAELADTDAERQQVEAVRGAFDRLVADARAVFALVDAGRQSEAFDLMEGRLEDQDFAGFQDVTEAAVQSDRETRDRVRAQTLGARRAAQTMLAVAVFGTLSLVLLLGGYLASDLFAPLRELERSLADVARGDLRRRLDAERRDELGGVNRAFNALAEAVARRERGAGLGATPAAGRADGVPAPAGAAWDGVPSRIALHALVSQLRTRVAALQRGGPGALTGGAGGAAAPTPAALLEEVDGLLHAVARVTEFGFPLDLTLAPTDVRALLYDVLLRFQEDLARRGASVEVQVAPEVGEAVVDRLKLRTALGELVRNALHALPERGGRVGLRAGIESAAGVGGAGGGSPAGALLVLEVADDGRGAPQSVLDRAPVPPGDPGGEPRHVGLRLTRAVVEQHGGTLRVRSEEGAGTYVRLALPLLRPGDP